MWQEFQTFKALCRHEISRKSVECRVLSRKKRCCQKSVWPLCTNRKKKSQFPGRRVQRSTSRGRTCKFTITYSCMSYCKFWIYCQTRVDTKFTIGQLYSMTQPRADPEIFQRGYEETKKGGGGLKWTFWEKSSCLFTL